VAIGGEKNNTLDELRLSLEAQILAGAIRSGNKIEPETISEAMNFVASFYQRKYGENVVPLVSFLELYAT
jgi:hypothetical protein